MQNLKIKMLKLILSLVAWSILLIDLATAQDKDPSQSTLVEKDIPPIESSKKQSPLKESKLIGRGIESILMGKKSTSLMFDNTQMDNINNAIVHFKNNESYVPPLLPEDSISTSAGDEKMERPANMISQYLRLDSIMFRDDKNWAVWLNSKKITKETNLKKNEFYIASVNKDFVKVVWKISLSKWEIIKGTEKKSKFPVKLTDSYAQLDIVIKPNQTFVLKDRKIYEGDVSSGLGGV